RLRLGRALRLLVGGRVPAARERNGRVRADPAAGAARERPGFPGRVVGGQSQEARRAHRRPLSTPGTRHAVAGRRAPPDRRTPPHPHVRRQHGRLSPRAGEGPEIARHILAAVPTTRDQVPDFGGPWFLSPLFEQTLAERKLDAESERQVRTFAERGY